MTRSTSMAFRRPAAVLALAALLLALLPTAGLAGPASLNFVPPTGQTAVKGGDTIGLSGSADADADVRSETLIALDASGVELARYSSVQGVVQNNGGNLSGAFILGCGSIPGCLSGDAALRARVDSYRLDAVVVSSSGSVPVSAGPIEFDEIHPEIVTYARTAANRFEVRFSEDVVEPDGDQPLDWTVDGLRQVVRVTEVGDRRVLETSGVFGPDETPLVRYEAQLSPGRGVTNLPYVDEARNTMLGRGRSQRAADRIPPAPPTIESIDGIDTARDGNDQAEPVLSNDSTPLVTISDMVDGHTARLFLDDGDGTLEDGRDTVIGDAVASGTTATIEWPASLALPDGQHRLFARAYDAALCDPNVPAAGSCPNDSARSDDALYDLDTVAPTLDDPAFASASGVTVSISEIVTGPTTASDWSISNPDGSAGPAVTDVSGQGDSRVLSAAGVVPDSTLRYEPSGARFVDDHGNELADVTIAVVAAPFPVLRLVDAAALEKNGPAGFGPTYSENVVAIGLELSDPPRLGDTAEVTLRVVDGTAVAGTDYTTPDASDLTVTFTGSQTSATLLVELRGDGLDEFDETFLVEVVDSNDAVIVADDDAIGTITDDDALVQLSVADGSATEGAVATVTATIRNGSGDAITSGKEIVADWSLRPVADAPGVHPASEGVDYPAASGTLRIAPGSTSATVDLSTIQDAIDEFDETFELVIGQVTNADVADGTAIVTILDDDDSPSLSIADFTTFEGETTRTEQLTVTLSEASGREVTVNVATADGTATFADGDYSPTNETLTFPPGSRTAIVDVEVVGDVRPEGDETFTVGLSSPNSSTISDGSATVTLLEDDGGLPPIGLTVTGAEVMEDVGGPLGTLFPGQISWTFELSRAASGPIRINYETTDDGTATIGTEFDDKRGTLTIPAGETVATVATNITDDDLDENDETVALLVQDPVGAELRADDGTPTAPLISFATIVDDEDLPSIAFEADSANVVVNEGDQQTLTVELDEASGRDVTVDWATKFDGDATSDEDAEQQSGTVTVPAGSLTASFVIRTLDDAIEEDDETFSVVLSSATNATLDSAADVAVVTIADDEVRLPVATIAGGTINEREAAPIGPAGPGPTVVLTGLIEEPLPFTVTLDRSSDSDVLVDWTTTDAGTAIAGSDFVSASGTLTIPAGETDGTIPVDVEDDLPDEFDETVEVRFSNLRGARFASAAARATAEGTITDDDPLAEAAIGADQTVTEGEPATFEIALDVVSGKDVRLRVRTVDGTAEAPGDHRAVDRVVTLPAGSQSTSVTVLTRDDAIPEGTEQLELELSLVDDDTATLGRSRAVLTIEDDDVDRVDLNTVIVSLTGASVEEGDPAPLGLPAPASTLDFTVVLSGPADGDVTVDFMTSQGTAGAGDDFVAASGSVVIPDGAEEAVVLIEVIPDTLDEADEDMQLVLTAVRGNAVLPGGRLARTGRILDDDASPSLRVADATVFEGEVATVAVTLDQPSGRPVTVAWSLEPGSAGPGDYLDEDGTLTFEPGVTRREISVRTLPDTDIELIEQLEVVLTAPVNAVLGDPRGTVSIVDVLGGQSAVAVDDVEVHETDADRQIQVPVRLLNPRDEDTVVTWSSQRLTATPDEDYVAAGGEVSIPAGATEAAITVTIVGDDEIELREDFLVLLTEAQGAVITGPTGRVTIADDDGPDDDDGDGNGGTDGDGALGAPETDDGQLPATGGGAALVGLLSVAGAAARRRRRRSDD